MDANKKIGYIQTLKAISFGIVIAYLIMALLEGPYWIFEIDFVKVLIFAAGFIFVLGFFVGKYLGVLIAQRNNFAILIGIIGAFAIVWFTVLITSVFFLFTEGLSNDILLDSLISYIFKPFILVTIFGAIPILFLGTWLGVNIRKRIKNL